LRIERANKKIAQSPADKITQILPTQLIKQLNKNEEKYS
jgi:hypothetical protein